MAATIFQKIGPKPFIAVAAASAVLAGLGGYILQQEHRPAVLEIYVFALKSGRSMFVRTPNDKRILVDGGANSDIIKELTEILPFYSRRIDTVIATNSEGKNVSGLIDILNRYTVDRVIVPAVTVESLGLASSTDQIYSTFIDAANQKNIPIQKVFVGERLIFDEKVVADILFPVPPENFAYSRASAPELIINISYGANSILFAGSASMKVQKFIAFATTSASAIKTAQESSIKKSLNDPNVLIFTQNPSPANLSAAFTGHFKPEYIVYSKEISKTTNSPITKTTRPTKTSNQVDSSKKKPMKVPPDSLANIPIDNQFNLKEQGTVKITSNGSSIEIKKAP